MSIEALKLALEALEAKGDAWIVLERKAKAAIKEALAQPEQKPMAYPEKCPITRRDFFMLIEHPTLGLVPTYGGPYNSYTIPHMEGTAEQLWHERELVCHRFDHDEGYWMDDVMGVETIPLRVISEGALNELLELKDTHPPVPIAQPKEQESVAFPDAPQTIYLQVGDGCPEDAKWKELVDVCWCDKQVFDNDIVYVRADTTPPQRTWVGLTEQEQGAIMESLNAYGTNLYHFANAIEAKLKEKNT